MAFERCQQFGDTSINKYLAEGRTSQIEWLEKLPQALRDRPIRYE